eukprot:177874-Alexandrium_andersonii.AAC.1
MAMHVTRTTLHRCMKAMCCEHSGPKRETQNTHIRNARPETQEPLLTDPRNAQPRNAKRTRSGERG